MTTSDTLSDHATTSQPATDPEVIELHWMEGDDVTMHADSGVAVPTLCGVWMEPDEALAAEAVAGLGGPRYVSCRKCDVLHALAELQARQAG